MIAMPMSTAMLCCSRLQEHQGVIIRESNVLPTQADEDWKTRFGQVERFPRPPVG
jgi:hypothetical protein